MSIVPHEWSVVIVGHWNRAILTPAGIVKRLFRLPADTKVGVQVALDAFVPHQVKHEDVVVIAGSDRLVVQPAALEYSAFEASMRVAHTALEELPETPVFGAGFNLNFRTDRYVEILAAITGHSWDDRLIDDGFVIHTRSITRALKWKSGLIRITVTEEADATSAIFMNYDRDSTSVADLRTWLSIPIAEVRRTTEKILSSCIGLELEEIRYDTKAD
jgi:hypothetical protein